MSTCVMFLPLFPSFVQ